MALGRKTASEKVASFLLMIARHIGGAAAPDQGCAQFELPLTRSDIAAFLGLTLETVSRQISQLRDDRVIEIEKSRQIAIPDIDRLSALAGD